MKYVVDTNVPIVANGLNTNASPSCRLAAIDFLEELINKGILVLDLAGEIEAEYARHLSHGQPGVGNRFIQAFLTTAANRVERYDVPKERNGSYKNYPRGSSLKKFDMSDRKFVALSVVSNAPVANAVDSDWLECLDALKANGVVVRFICGNDRSKWHK